MCNAWRWLSSLGNLVLSIFVLQNISDLTIFFKDALCCFLTATFKMGGIGHFYSTSMNLLLF